ncbi:MAG: carbon-nitrogen hydrolase family protein [Mobilitalea sp.]
MNNFKVAMIQHKITESDQQRNTELGLQYVRQAKQIGADFVLFPECWITSYNPPEILCKKKPFVEVEREPEFIAWRDSALTEESNLIKSFCQLAKELSIGIEITGFTKGQRSAQNTAFIINREGEIILKYSKVHTCDFDWEGYLESGDQFNVCHFDDICIGVMICYDREYPESARELMLQGAELILMPNDCGGMKPRLQELSVRALENMVGIAMANPPGEDAGNSCAFYPMVWDEEGNIIDNTIIIADSMEEGIVLAIFDVDAIREHRSREDMGKYRKPKAYKHLLGERVSHN